MKFFGVAANEIDKALWAIADAARETRVVELDNAPDMYSRVQPIKKRVDDGLSALAVAERALSREVSIRFREGQFRDIHDATDRSLPDVPGTEAK